MRISKFMSGSETPRDHLAPGEYTGGTAGSAHATLPPRVFTGGYMVQFPDALIFFLIPLDAAPPNTVLSDSTEDTHMFFQIDFGNGLAIYDQVVRQVKFAVAGEVAEGRRTGPLRPGAGPRADHQPQHRRPGVSPVAGRRRAGAGPRHGAGRGRRGRPPLPARADRS